MKKRAREMPVAKTSSGHMMRNGFAGDMRRLVRQKCYTLALKHGLPEIEGYYDCDLSSGEFIEEC